MVIGSDSTDQKNLFMKNEGIFYPTPLIPGDKIALISPASAVKEEYVYGAMDKIRDRGYEPVLMPYALGHVDGSFAASKGERLMDFLDALQDPEIKAIFCTRGGYGCPQLISNLSFGLISNNPKWIIGFSDVSALHALWYKANVASIHGPMAKHLATMPDNDPCSEALFQMLENGGKFDYSVAPHEYNRLGEATGILIGGNWAVLNDLSNTPFDIIDCNQGDKNFILFLEDISEPIYKVNRMLYRLYNSGALFRVKGLIFGNFTEYKPDLNFQSIEDMVHDFLQRLLPETSFPVVFNFPTGHTDYNLPLVEGSEVSLSVTNKKVRLHN